MLEITVHEISGKCPVYKFGSNVLVGISSDNILEIPSKMIKVTPEWPRPFGEGHTGKKLLKF